MREPRHGLGLDRSTRALVTIQFFVSLKGALGCAQSDSLTLPRAEVLDPCSSQGCHSDACGLQALAGLWMMSYIEGPPDIAVIGQLA